MWGFHQWLHRRTDTGARLQLAAEDGQALLEYALVLALIAIVSIGTLKALGVNISGLMSHVGSRMASVSNP
jgi:Flp pilus assembly pilin Flp